MSSSYLTLNDVRGGRRIEMDDSDFDALSESIPYLVTAYLAEEKIDLLTEGFIDLERQLMELALQDSVRGFFENYNVEESQPALNRKVINLLTAAKMYVDQVRH